MAGKLVRLRESLRGVIAICELLPLKCGDALDEGADGVTRLWSPERAGAVWIWHVAQPRGLDLQKPATKKSAIRTAFFSSFPFFEHGDATRAHGFRVVVLVANYKVYLSHFTASWRGACVNEVGDPRWLDRF